MSIITQLRQEIKAAKDKISQIQEECCHPASAVTKIARADTGNYDRSQDGYWYECRCSLCEKQWTEDQVRK